MVRHRHERLRHTSQGVAMNCFAELLQLVFVLLVAVPLTLACSLGEPGVFA